MIVFPKLLLGADAKRVLRLCCEIRDSREEPVICDGSRLIHAEPMPLCAIAATLERLRREGRTVQVIDVSELVKRNLERLDVLSAWLIPSTRLEKSHATGYGAIHTYRAKSHQEADQLASTLARAIVELFPRHRFIGHLAGGEGPKEYDPIERPLGYMITELLDNSLMHGRAHGFGHATVWLSAQYYARGDLVRFTVLDDGCGFLSTFRGRQDLALRSHRDAVLTAFKPFVSCNREVRLFGDAVNQGLGLTICRDICHRAEGSISVISGDAWVTDPLIAGEKCQLAPFWKGAIVSVEIHRDALNQFNFVEITGKYAPAENLPIRFF